MWPTPSPPSKRELSLTVAIIGAGPLGRWLAMSAARAGFRVLLEDVMPKNLHHAQEFLRRELDAELREGRVRPVDTYERVTFVSTVEDAVRDADLAIDCVPDELESKLEILWLLDRMAPPRTVLATPTTRLSIGDLASCTYRPDKCLAIAVEASTLAEKIGTAIPLLTTPQTSLATLELVESFWKKLGYPTDVQVEAAGVAIPASAENIPLG
jgi:3-hydroxybutyryl-CoA dehydrogenase